MSSLLQHHGTIRGNQVELLMYRQHYIEVRPLSCDWCNTPYVKSFGYICGGCQRAICFLSEHRNPDLPVDKILGPGEPYTMTVLREQWPEELITELQCGKREDCYCSNRWSPVDTEPVTLLRPDGAEARVPKLYRIWRQPVDMLGCWVRFRWSGKLHAPDLSVPINVLKLPRDAEALTNAEAAAYWFKETSW